MDEVLKLDRAKVRALVESAAKGPFSALVVRDEFSEMGATANMCVGRKMENGDDTCVAWYVGQFMDIVEHGAWFAMNSLICHLNKFVPLNAPEAGTNPLDSDLL